MRKVAILLTTLAFFSCLAIGIWLSNQTPLTEKNPSPPTEVPTPAELTHQTNLIFVHVDDLQSPRPALRSLWGFFISLQDPVNVMITPLLPFANQETQLKLLRSFRLNDHHTPDPRFVENVRKELNLTFAEYILIDDTGMSMTAGWIGDRTGAPFDYALNDISSLPDAEQAFFSSICAIIDQSPADGSRFIWNDLLPDYAYTNLSFQNAIRIWMSITNPEKPTRCEVFYPTRTD